MNQRWQKTLGQSLNSAGVASFLSVATREPHLALPHLSVPDFRWIDWPELERLGFRGVVFDKENTLTAPYSLSHSLWPALSGSFVLSTPQKTEFSLISILLLGIRELDKRYSTTSVHSNEQELKKPAGTIEDIEKWFGYLASDLIMLGDRHFIDFIYGNQNDFLIILTESLNLSLKPFIMKQLSSQPPQEFSAMRRAFMKRTLDLPSQFESFSLNLFLLVIRNSSAVA